MISYIFDVLQQMRETAEQAGVVIVSYRSMFLLTLCISLGVSLVVFILKGIGLYSIGKREGIGKPFLAFIPIASIFYMGKIIGKVKLFNFKVKNLGLLVMITYLLQLIFSGIFDWMYCGNALISLFENDVLVSLEDYVYTDYMLFGIINLVSFFNVMTYILSIVYLILDVFLVFAFFRYYGGNHGTLYAFLSILFEPLFGIFVFAVRKQDRFDFSQYVKMNFGSYNASGSGGGFNNPQNPYSRPADGGSQKAEDPFTEYGSYSAGANKNGGVEDVFTDYPESSTDASKKVYNTDDDNNNDEDLF